MCVTKEKGPLPCLHSVRFPGLCPASALFVYISAYVFQPSNKWGLSAQKSVGRTPALSEIWTFSFCRSSYLMFTAHQMEHFLSALDLSHVSIWPIESIWNRGGKNFNNIQANQSDLLLVI